MDVWFADRLRSWAVGALVAVVLGACGTQVEVQTTTAGAGPTVTPAEAVASNPADVTDTAAEPDAPDSDADPDQMADESGRPDPSSEPLHVPARGEPVAVVGVAFDDTVVMRAAPRAEAEVTAELSARFEGAVGTGGGRTNDGTAWWRVRVGSNQGWVDASTMARLGATTDATADVVDDLGERPRAPTMQSLGRTVASARLGAAAEDGRIVVSAAPRVDDLGEIAIDIVDVADDSVAGERLVVIGTPDGDGFLLESVESTVFCARGVTGDGRCT